MISEKRILAVFRKSGGPDALTSVFSETSQPVQSFVEKTLKGNRPLIARIQSRANWFALTGSELIISVEGGIQSTRLSDIEAVVLRDGMRQLLDGKVFGAPIELKLADGSVLAVPQDAGKPFTGMLNVFMYIARVNQRRPRGHELALDAADESTRTQ